MDKDKFLTAKELCQYLKIPRVSLYRFLKMGQIPGAKIGKQWRFNRETIDKWMAGKEKYYTQRKGLRKTDIASK